MEQNIQNVNNNPAEKKETKTWIMACYILNVASILLGFTTLVAVVIAYVFRGDVKGTIWESHCQYLIRTFWISVLFGFIGTVLVFVLIGWLVLLAVFVWFIIRNIKGIKALSENKAIENPTTWLF